MANAKKLPSGQWRTLAYSHTDADGKRKYESFTATTKKESEFLAAEFLLNKTERRENKISLKDALDKYIESKENVLSPSTVLGYKNYKRYMADISHLYLTQLTRDVVQVWVNSMTKLHSPKTVKNAYGLLSTTLKNNDVFLTGISLPQKVKPTYCLPSDEDIKSLVAYFNEYDREMLKAVYLAAYGTLRRSEISGLYAKSIKGNVIHVCNAVVMDKDRKWVEKTTKTVSSDRYVELPEFVVQSFPSAGKVVDLTPSQISDRFQRALKKNKVPKFRFHDLRHYSASLMHAIGVPDQYIMQRGGWSSDTVLKQVYRGTMNEYSRHYTDKTNEYFESMQHDMQHKKEKPQ